MDRLIAERNQLLRLMFEAQLAKRRQLLFIFDSNTADSSEFLITNAVELDCFLNSAPAKFDWALVHLNQVLKETGNVIRINLTETPHAESERIAEVNTKFSRSDLIQAATELDFNLSCLEHVIFFQNVINQSASVEFNKPILESIRLHLSVTLKTSKRISEFILDFISSAPDIITQSVISPIALQLALWKYQVTRSVIDGESIKWAKRCFYQIASFLQGEFPDQFSDDDYKFLQIEDFKMEEANSWLQKGMTDKWHHKALGLIDNAWIIRNSFNPGLLNLIIPLFSSAQLHFADDFTGYQMLIMSSLACLESSANQISDFPKFIPAYLAWVFNSLSERKPLICSALVSVASTRAVIIPQETIYATKYQQIRFHVRELRKILLQLDVAILPNMRAALKPIFVYLNDRLCKYHTEFNPNSGNVEKGDFFECISLYLELYPIIQKLQITKRTLPISGCHHKCISELFKQSSLLRHQQRVETLKRLRIINRTNDGKDQDGKLISVKNLFLEQISDEHVFIDPLLQLMDKRDVWNHLFQPLLSQYRLEITNIFEECRIGERLDTTLIQIMNELHVANSAIYQIAVNLLGNAADQVKFIDLNAIADKYANGWFENFRFQAYEFVDRSIQKDSFTPEEIILGTSSSVGDCFVYLTSLCDIFLSLPFTSNCNYKTDGTNQQPALLSLKGLWKTVNEYLKPFCDLISNSAITYAEHITKFKYDAASFKTFCERRKLKEVIDEETFPLSQSLYVRINNLILVKHRLRELLIEKLKQSLDQIGGFITRICDESLASSQIILNQHLAKLLNYTALKIVHVDLKSDFINGLYTFDSVSKSVNGISASSLKTLVQILRGYLEDFMRYISADQVLKQELKESVKLTQTNSVALMLAFLYFVHVLSVFESIVFTDLFSARLLFPRDVAVILDDIKLFERLFAEGLDFDGESFHSNAIKHCLRPLLEIVSTLFPLETDQLIKTYDRLQSSEKQFKSEDFLSIGRKHRMDTKKANEESHSLCFDEIIDFVEQFEENRVRTIISNHKNGLSGSSILISHDFSRFRHYMQVEKSLGGAQDSRPINIWTSRNILHVLARRAGYGHPMFFPPEVGSTTPQLPSKGLADSNAVAFMKRYSVKHWFDKKISGISMKLIP